MSSSSGWSSIRRVLPLVLGTVALAMIWGRHVMERRESARMDAAAVLSYAEVWRANHPDGKPVELEIPHHQIGRMGTARGFLTALIALFGMATWIAAVAQTVHQAIEDRSTAGRGVFMLVSALFVVTAALFLTGLMLG